jgi:phosphomevalonate kinase
LVQSRENFQESRRLLKRLGQRAGVEIEPDQQSELLDATLALPGVLAGAVPGAGGQDAVYVLVLGAKSRRAVELLWAAWADGAQGRSRVCALLLSASTDAGIQSETS